MKKISTSLIILFTLGLFFTGKCQNLVSNPGFEDMKGKRHTHRPWRFVNTVDMYVIGDKVQRPRGTEKWYLPKPHGGSTYLGLRIYPDYREFIQIKLKQKLEKGKKYYFEMWVSWSEHSNCYARQFGASIYARKPSYTSKQHIYSNPPQINLYEHRGIRPDSTVWTKISGVYRAKGGERYLSIGNFAKQRMKDRLKRKHWYSINFWHLEAYYFLDDLLLVQLKDDFKKRQDPVAAIDSNVIVPDSIPYDILKENYIYAIDKKKQLNLQNIIFETGKADLAQASYRELELVLEYLNENQTVQLEIVGHTDNVGSPQSNLKLSERRAKAVYQYFVRNYIDKKRLSYVGKGELEPIASNVTAQGRKQNRRVEIRVIE